MAQFDHIQMGGIDLGVEVGTPGVIEITNTEIVGSGWSFKSAMFEADGARFESIALLSANMTDGPHEAFYARIYYDRIGEGWTPLRFTIGPESVVSVSSYDESPPPNNDVTNDYAFLPSFIGARPGDFDGDGDVDGRDLLVWQRDPSIGLLADWQNHYGGTLYETAVNSLSVPEPCSLLLLAIGTLGVAFGRRGLV